MININPNKGGTFDEGKKKFKLLVIEQFYQVNLTDKLASYKVNLILCLCFT